ncbi:MAG: type II secretion system protein GspC [Thermodesulfobacteriota bacterium]|nr:type II secretion system protein GspC [Thermodesulfobacteriota bacterium]
MLLNPRYYTILNLLVLGIVIYGGVDIFYTIAGSKLTEVAEEHTTTERFKVTPNQEKRRALSHYLRAAKTGLFGKVEEKPASELETEDLEPAELKATLLGTVSGDSKNAVAIIQEGARKTQSLYKEGDSVEEATILKILRGKVILRVGDKNQVLNMEENTRSSSTPERSRRSSRSDRPTGRSTTITLDRSTVTKSLEDINQLLSQVRVRPHYRDGKADGLMLSQIKPNTVFTKMRLRNGDVVQKVNGKPITSPDDIMEFYEELRSGSKVSLDISRRGRNRNLTYSFK